MHAIAVSFFRTVNYMIAIPAILLSTFSGAGSIGLASSCDADSLSIALGFLVLISGAMFSIHRYMNIPELQQMHDFYGDEFYKLSNSIRLNLVLSSDESRSFKNIQEYAKFIKGQIDICIDKAPGIPRHIVRKTKKRLGQLTIMSKCGDTEPQSDITYNPPVPLTREIKRVAELELAPPPTIPTMPPMPQSRSQAQNQSFTQLHIEGREHSKIYHSHHNMPLVHEDRPMPKAERSFESGRPRKDSTTSMACINPEIMPS